jgi:hypothetical protein
MGSLGSNECLVVKKGIKEIFEDNKSAINIHP